MPKPSLLHRIAAFVAFCYLRFVGWTSFVETWDHPAYLSYRRKRKTAIYGFWHNAQVFLAYHHRGERVSIMVSRSKDGEYIAQVMNKVDLNPVRGSSTRGGSQAFLEIMEHLEHKEQVGFTPDGPRGPVHTVQGGIVMAAQKSGAPVLTAHAALRRAIVFNSWDKFEMPLPFGHAVVAHGRPTEIPSSKTETAAREQVRRLLNDNVKVAAEAEKSAPSYAQSFCAAETLAIYNLLSPFFLILSLPFFLKKHGLKKFLAGTAERFGRSYPARAAKKRYWFHAASIGEWQAAKAWANSLEKGAELLITTSAPESRDFIRKEQPKASVHLLPLDLPWIIRPWIKRWNPDAVFLLETELWPNLIETCAKQYVPVFLVNARLSEKGLRKRWWVRPLLVRLLRKLSRVYARTEEDAARYKKLGAPATRIDVTGNLKIDILSVLGRDDKKEKRRALWKNVPGVIVVGGSTWGKEEEMMLQLLEKPGCEEMRLAIAPRRPVRFEAVAQLLERKGVSYDRWSKIKNGGSWTERVLLVDTIGDLKKMYAASDAAFIGGSFEKRGGQNPLEAAAAGNAVVFGASMQNFSNEAKMLLSKGAAFQRPDEAGLVAALAKLVKDAALRRSMGEKAAQTIRQNQGLSEKILASLREQLEISG